MNEEQYELSRELRGYESDRRMTERAVSSVQNRWKELLEGEMGDDIRDVTSGKKKVKLSLSEKLSYKWRTLKDKVRKLKRNKEKNEIL